MKTFYLKTLVILVLLPLFSIDLEAQQTEIEYDSGIFNPQLLLKETDGGFSRLNFENNNTGFQTLAGRTGNISDFIVYYHNGTNGKDIINVNGPNNKTTFDSGVEVLTDAGTTLNPSTLELAENNTTGYSVLRYTNTNVPGSFTTEVNNQYSSAIAGNADYRINFSEDGINKRTIFSALYAYRDHTGISLTNSKDERVGIRTGAPLTDLHLVHKNGITGHGFRIEHEGSNNHWWKMYVSDGNGTLSFRNSASPNSNVGTFATNGTYTASDSRLKRDIEEAPYGLKEVMKMNAKRYHYKSDKKDEQKSIGFIAQDINEISPELVLYDVEADQYSLNYAAINVIAIKAIQEQQNIIEDKVKDINNLKSEMASLRAMIEDIKSNK